MPNQTLEALEADAAGEKPDLGRTPDTLADALSGSDVGSDTRAGSLRGGSASGSDVDPDQVVVNAALAKAGRAAQGSRADRPADPDPVVNAGPIVGQAEAPPKDGSNPADGDAEASTG